MSAREALMEIRQGSNDEWAVWDHTGRIGDMFHLGPDPEDEPGAEYGWVVELWGFRFGRVRSTAPTPTAAEAIDVARDLYDELLEERRYQARVDRNQPRTVTIPTGGQPRR
jgi:hypothetical protein